MAHRWQFFRAGGVDQVLIRSGADIAHLRELDQKLWVALACPTRGIRFDNRTLDLVDEDKDGRIRAPEVIAAAEWACARLADADELVRPDEGIRLAALADNDAGREIAADARAVLEGLGRPEAERLTLADIDERNKRQGSLGLNGDGVIVAASLESAALKTLFDDIVATQGSLPDRNGEHGIDRKRTEAYFAGVDALAAWQRRPHDDATLKPQGDGTAAAVAALDDVRAKVDDYFARCQLGAYDERLTQALNPSAEQVHALALQTLSLDSGPLVGLPLAQVGPGRPLPLQGRVNPAWNDALQRLRDHVAVPLLGPDIRSLTEADWRRMQALLEPARAWLAQRPASDKIAKRGSFPAEAAAGSEARQALLALIADDEALAPQHDRGVRLEKMLRLRRDLLTLLHNFVSFADFYRRAGATFQAGTLYLDGRSCELSVRVDDPAKHAVLAGMAKVFLAYCDCRRGDQTMRIVSAFTAGDIDFLLVGRNGVFYDRDGHDWDATITKLIENPTSIGQAFFSPYKKFLRIVEEQVAKRAAARDAASNTGLSAIAGRIASAPGASTRTAAAATPAGVKLRPSRVDVGTVAAIGVALGSLGTMVVGIFGRFIELGWWIPVALLCIVLAISGPSMLIAWLKLRQRSLGPILDASGWAINGRMRINVRLGGSLTQRGRVPPGAARSLRDPYDERNGLRNTVVALLIVAALAAVAWRGGGLDSLRARWSAATQPSPVTVGAPPTPTAPTPGASR